MDLARNWKQTQPTCQFSNFLLDSRLADVRLHFELMINGVERLADILENVHDFAVDVFVGQHLPR